MNYALFFDIDGTLVSFSTHQIPASTIEALTQAKANGARIYISTGRPIQIITNLKPIEHLIDGYITTNGALCFVGRDIIRCAPIAEEDVQMFINDAQKYDYAGIVIGEQDMAVFNPKQIVEDVFCKELAVQNLDKVLPIEHVLHQRILQITPFFPIEHETVLMHKMPHSISARWHPAFTDITAKNADKGIGLQAMAAHQGIDISQTVAFGDGGNDISILRMAGTGVAMGNAHDHVKAEADYITSSVDDNGIQQALKHLNII